MREERSPEQRLSDTKTGFSPKTEIGRKVKMGEIKDINEILDEGLNILEEQVVDILLPNLEVDLIHVGQSKGKFGGGKRTIWRTTQKKTKEGNRLKFTAMAIVGNQDGYVGLGIGSAKENLPAKEKAIRKAKLSLIKIKRGCGSWECGCKEAHSLPFIVEGKYGSSKVKLIPAPKGTGLRVEKELAKMLRLAGIKDAYGKIMGSSKVKINLLNAGFKSLKQLGDIKISDEKVKQLGIVSGRK